ncbi:unnamed protein product [Arctia plantaginis]|uniref:Uncharacterized protein n=1 Tax=Arctia plantaginis TaxID=874455 RepID=A0A8S1AC13_ARCPL|nr:unnamed protein product [Arctia plantaginis]
MGHLDSESALCSRPRPSSFLGRYRASLLTVFIGEYKTVGFTTSTELVYCECGHAPTASALSVSVLLRDASPRRPPT